MTKFLNRKSTSYHRVSRIGEIWHTIMKTIKDKSKSIDWLAGADKLRLWENKLGSKRYQMLMKLEAKMHTSTPVLTIWSTPGSLVNSRAKLPKEAARPTPKAIPASTPVWKGGRKRPCFKYSIQRNEKFRNFQLKFFLSATKLSNKTQSKTGQSSYYL